MHRAVAVVPDDHVALIDRRRVWRKGLCAVPTHDVDGRRRWADGRGEAAAARTTTATPQGHRGSNGNCRSAEQWGPHRHLLPLGRITLTVGKRQATRDRFESSEMQAEA